jgi:phenylalanyl-tRNA synthetase alpha subunit
VSPPELRFPLAPWRVFPSRSYSEQLGKWIEVGNSGMFRPEMLRPMGLPEGVNVIAWGLGLER